MTSSISVLSGIISQHHNIRQPCVETSSMPFAPSLLSGFTTSSLATTRLRLRCNCFTVVGTTTFAPKHTGQTSWWSPEQESTKGALPSICFFSVCHISGKTPISTKTRALAKNHLAILGCSLSEIRLITQITSNTPTNHKPHSGIDAKKIRWSQCPYFLLELGVAPSGCHHSPCYPMVPAIAEQSLYTKGTSDGRHQPI